MTDTNCRPPQLGSACRIAPSDENYTVAEIAELLREALAVGRKQPAGRAGADLWCDFLDRLDRLRASILTCTRLPPFELLRRVIEDMQRDPEAGSPPLALEEISRADLHRPPSMRAPRRRQSEEP